MRRQIAENSADMKKTERETILLQDATYKVLSLGMWLKLATDSRLMLLLLRVLRWEKSKQNIRPIRWQSRFMCQ